MSLRRASFAILPLSALCALPVGALRADNIAPKATEYNEAPSPENLAARELFRQRAYGLFVHYGLYSVSGVGEWQMFQDSLDAADYYAERLPHFKPKADCIDEWIKLAKDAGMRYIVLTTRHHEGYWLGDDFIREYTTKARAAGLGVGVYFSVADWSDPGYCAGSAGDPEGWRKFVDKAHRHLRHLMTDFGKVEYLFYDGCPPPEEWDLLSINREMRRLQPHLLICRGGIDCDFKSCEDNIVHGGAPLWEACYTFNRSWGYNKYDFDFKSLPSTVDMLYTIRHNRGNFLLNVGPMADGTVQPEAADRLRALGKWVKANEEAIFDVVPHPDSWALRERICCSRTNRSVGYWMSKQNRVRDGRVICGISNKVDRVTYLDSGEEIPFVQDNTGHTPRLKLLKMRPSTKDDLPYIVKIEYRGDPQGVCNERLPEYARNNQAAAIAKDAKACAAPPWEDPAVNAENRLEDRAYLPPASPYVMSLAGEWEFAWEGGADGDIATNAPERIATPFRIQVPCCVETRGWGVPHYTNFRYPHPMTPPAIDPKYNPTMLYRTHFALPANWTGRRVVLRFEGVSSCAEIWVNGKRVGYFEDSRLPSEFDITPVLGSSTLNSLVVRVRKWCDGSYVEDQDMIRYAGIFRDVKLLAEAKDGVRDVVVTTVPDADYRIWTVTVKGGDRDETFALENPRLWSDEDPYLYEHAVRRNGDERRIRYGVRDCRVENGLLLVNGKPVKFKGVNRHELSVGDGYTVTYEQMLADVKLMKQNNINMVRTSHYPFDPRFYDLCDEYGLYVCAEANVEAHGMRYGHDCLMERPEWRPTVVERNVRQVKAYRNHPSVIMWSFGNESGWGRNVAAVREAIRALDPRTPFHGVGWKNTPDHPHAPVWDDSDMTGGQYHSLDWVRARIADDKPFFMMEYSCAMGNGMGNFKEYWDVFYESDKLSGGCVWDWIDQGIWIDTDRTDEQGRRIRYLGYGGDHDEFPNDGPYCANGLVDVFRNPSGKLVEVKHVQQPVEVRTADAAQGSAEFWNRYEFTYADEVLYGVWELSEDGRAVARGELQVPHVPPRQKGTLVLPKPEVKIDPAKEYFYRVSFRQKRDVRWGSKGYEQAWNQLPYKAGSGNRESGMKAGSASPYAVAETEEEISVVANDKSVEAVFRRATGTLAKLTLKGKLILADKAGIVHGPRLQVERAFTNSDTWMRLPFIKAGLTQLQFRPYAMKVEKVAGAGKAEIVRVVCPVRVTGAKTGGFETVVTWSFRPDGTIRIDNEMTPFGDIPSLPRVGSFLRLDGALENLRYYGRGPWENMIDRSSGCDIAEWHSTVADQYVAHMRPQDCGGKTDVRWAELVDPKDGRGVRFTSVGEPFFLQALHFTRGDLDASRHRPAEETISRTVEPARFVRLVPREEVCLSIDCRQMGLGCNSCGPIPLPRYRFPVERTAWSYVVSPNK